jgi:GH24 family phage-related lysozyme (muramidase)
MASIRLRDAAFHFRELPHQIAAFEWLEDQLRPSELEEFAEIYRGGPDPLPPETPAAAGDAIGLALPLIEHFEGLELEAYPDPLSGGDPWTIGIGSTRHLDGTPVRRGDVVTEALAREMLLCYAKECEATQRRRIPTWDAMNAQQQAAILSFAFNFGAHWFNSHGFATLTRNLQQSDWDAVPDTLKMYRNPNSVVEAGLLRRRVAEGELFATGRWAQG